MFTSPPTYKLPPTPAPPLTTNAPVQVDVADVILLAVNAPAVSSLLFVL